MLERNISFGGSVKKTLLALGFALLSVFCRNANAAGPELVEVVNVAPVQAYTCSKKTPTCFVSTKYLVTFKRSNGMSDSIVTESYVTAKKLVVNFCPGLQGQLERPCSTM